MSDAIVPQGLQVDSPTFFFIHPLGTLLFPRIADNGEFDHLGASTWGESTNTGDLLTELLRARNPRALKTDYIQARNFKAKTVTLNRVGLKMSRLITPVIARYFFSERLTCFGFEGSYLTDPGVPYVYLTIRPMTGWLRWYEIAPTVTALFLEQA